MASSAERCTRGSPCLQQVVNAIAAALGYSRRFVCYLDCDQDHLQELASHLTKSGGGQVHPLLIRTPFADPSWDHWIRLLESVVAATEIGFVSELDEVVANLARHSATPPSFGAHHPPVEDDYVLDPLAAPNSVEEITGARARLLAWAQIESLAEVDYVPVFAPLVGGVRPIVVVLDDYNNYLQTNAGAFEPVESVSTEIAEHYGARGPREDKAAWFKGILGGYCRRLNNLAVSCDVRAPQRDYGTVRSAIPFDDLDRVREKISAFVVDLEWRPPIGREGASVVAKWSEMGYRAIHLLRARYPEIPCFVYTGEWSIEKLQEALAHGASWCFRKTESHHGYAPAVSPELTCFELERSLRAAVNVRYGSFSELPYPDQLAIDPKDDLGKAIIDGLKVDVPIGQCPKGKNLLNLIARLFPDGSSVKPVRVLSSGRSKAQATFFLEAFRGGGKLATRFIKMAGWLDIQREYFAYTDVIRPRLNSYLANVIGEPIVADGTDGEMPMGAILYSLAGFPEDYENLNSLGSLLKDPAALRDGTVIADRLRHTLEKVLRCLYPKPPRKARKPLWRWLGEILPPVYTGVLIPLDCLDGVGRKTTVSSDVEQGGEDEESWRRASESLRKISSSRTDLSPETDDFSEVTSIELADFSLLEARWGRSENPEQITLAHPDLGLRIRLRGRGGDIRRRFGAVWIRPRFPVRVAACIDSKNRESEKLERRILSASTGLDLGTVRYLLGSFSKQTGVAVRDPFEMFCDGGIPHHHVVEAHEGPIHGDLNLGNILFADSGPGWLIDFEYSTDHGMLALDLAKLEAEIWRHHLFPSLEKVAEGHTGKEGVHFKLLNWAHSALESDAESGEAFAKSVRSYPAFSAIKEDELLPAMALLGVIATVRTFALQKMSLSDSELRWALAAYFFVSAKFFEEKERWPIIFGFLSSAMHLEKAIRQDPTLLLPDQL